MRKILYFVIPLIFFTQTSGIIPMPIGTGKTTSGDSWNTTLSNSSWIFTNSNLTKNSNTVTNGSGITSTALSGKLIWGYACGTLAHLEACGIATSGFDKNQFCGATTASYGLLSGGNGLYTNSGSQVYAGQPNYTTGDTVYIAFDASANIIWFGKYNSATHLYLWSGTSGNPSTGIGGFTVTSATYYVSGGDQHGNTSTLIFGTNVAALAIPSGFTAKQ